jgi:hypothetical protein
LPYASVQRREHLKDSGNRFGPPAGETSQTPEIPQRLFPEAPPPQRDLLGSETAVLFYFSQENHAIPIRATYDLARVKIHASKSTDLVLHKMFVDKPNVPVASDPQPDEPVPTVSGRIFIEPNRRQS